MTTASENIHHCYLLKSLSSSAHYIGYTTNPHRRLSQHNGKIKGGAAETSRNQPWKFLAILSNLPNETNGLQMEWAWQHPRRSKVFRAAMRGRLASSREMMAKQIESDKSTEGYLRRLLILLCESDYGKPQFSCNNELGIYFFENNVRDIFHGLMREYKERQNRSADDSDDEKRSPFCCTLPNHVKVHLVNSVKDLPFYEKIRSERKRRRKSSIEPGNIINHVAKQQYDEDDSCDEVDSYSDEENNEVDQNIRMINNSIDYLDVDDTEIIKDDVVRMSLGGLSLDSTSTASVIDLLDKSDDGEDLHEPETDVDIITPTKSRQKNGHIESPIDLTSPDNNDRIRLLPGEEADSDATIDLCSP